MTARSNPPTPWQPICRLDDIPPLGARVLRREGAPDIALFRTAEDRVFALLDRCPHKGGPLSQGIVAGDTVTCPLHGWNIALASGEACAPDVGCAPRFEVRVEDGEVWLALGSTDDDGRGRGFSPDREAADAAEMAVAAHAAPASSVVGDRG